MTVHIYYYDPKTLDLNKLKEQATEISTGDYRTEPRPVVLHYHKVGEPCVGDCCDVYPVKED